MPSIRLDGTNAKISHLVICPGAGRSVDAGATKTVVEVARRQINARHDNSPSANARKALCQIEICSDIGKKRSNIVGNSNNARKLPALLAAYKKYGSRAERLFDSPNQCCNKGALLDRKTNGKPT